MKPIISAISLLALCCSCGGHSGCRTENDTQLNKTIELQQQIKAVTDTAKGIVGVAVITPEKDTVAINNDVRYPLMSVFKLHEALAVVSSLDSLNQTVDSTMAIDFRQLDRQTWSPMLKAYPDTICNITVKELLRYILQESDNNASNILFERVVPVDKTDRFIREVAGINNFGLKYTEAQMQKQHELSRENWSSPLDCAILIDKVINDSIVSAANQEMIRDILYGCQTGQDRLCVALQNDPVAKIAHKTGSGYRDVQGLLIAHNDIGYVQLGDGRGYSIAVLVTSFEGTEGDASKIIAEISKIAYNSFASAEYGN